MNQGGQGQGDEGTNRAVGAQVAEPRPVAANDWKDFVDRLFDRLTATVTCMAAIYVVEVNSLWEDPQKFKAYMAKVWTMIGVGLALSMTRMILNWGFNKLIINWASIITFIRGTFGNIWAIICAIFWGVGNFFRGIWIFVQALWGICQISWYIIQFVFRRNAPPPQPDQEGPTMA